MAPVHGACRVKITPLAIPDVLLLQPDIHADDRGFFCETFHAGRFRALTGFAGPFVQDNFSRSAAGVLRGLHFQQGRPQGKLVRVTRGAIFDVAVDLRPGSATLGQWVAAELSELNQLQMWIPPGFAHGLLALEQGADVIYKVTDHHAPELERSIAWDDPELGIAWPLSGPPILSARDRRAMPLSQALR